jgi:hypothetical protein
MREKFIVRLDRRSTRWYYLNKHAINNKYKFHKSLLGSACRVFLALLERILCRFCQSLFSLTGSAGFAVLLWDFEVKSVSIQLFWKLKSDHWKIIFSYLRSSMFFSFWILFFYEFICSLLYSFAFKRRKLDSSAPPRLTQHAYQRYKSVRKSSTYVLWYFFCFLQSCLQKISR